MTVYIVGCGMGDRSLLTCRAEEIIKNSDVILSTKRIADMFNSENISVMSLSEIEKYILDNAKTDKKICVLATGDVGFYSVANTVKRKVGDSADIRLINGISSFQYFTAKLCKTYENTKLVSLHGLDRSIVPYVCYNKSVFCLTGGRKKADDIISELIRYGLGEVFVYVGENLSAANEKIISAKAYELKNEAFGDLAVMLIENDNAADRFEFLSDEDFIRNSTPMTKENIRSLSVDMLGICPSDIVYDVGAGTGSVSICMARKACESMVYAIEKDERAREVFARNITKFKTFNINIVKGTAPSALAELPSADKVFIGGSSGNMAEIISSIIEKNRNARFVVNAVTVETLAETVEIFKRLDMKYDIVCVNVSHADKLGRYNLMKAENPVYIIKGEKYAE